MTINNIGETAYIDGISFSNQAIPILHFILKTNDDVIWKIRKLANLIRFFKDKLSSLLIEKFR